MCRVGGHVRLQEQLLAGRIADRARKGRGEPFAGGAASSWISSGCCAYAEQPANSLAFGHQRLLEIARALACRPRLLLLDEPAAGLNSSELELLVGLIQHIRETSGLSVLLIGHTMRLVMTLSDRIVVLDHGVQLAEGLPLEIQNNARVIEAYLGTDNAA